MTYEPLSKASTSINELSDFGKVKRKMAALSVGVISVNTSWSERYTLKNMVL